MKYFNLLLIVVFFLKVNIAFSNEPSSNSTTQSEARLALKKWGLSYCLKKYSKKDPDLAYSSSMESYFQNGGHANELAYISIRKYFDMKFKSDLRIGKLNSSQILTKCLDAYEKKAYSTVIRKQDSYISPQ
jgi:hypothetical protein